MPISHVQMNAWVNDEVSKMKHKKGIYIKQPLNRTA